MKITRWLGVQLLLPVLLLGALLLLARPSPTDAQSGVTHFTTVSASRDVVAGRDVQAGVDLLVGGFATFAPGATAVMTNGGYLTPTTTVAPLSAIAAVGVSGANIAVLPAGTLLVLLNVGSNTITFTETGTLVSAGNIALGANDSATLLSNGTNWYQIGASNN